LLDYVYSALTTSIIVAFNALVQWAGFSWFLLSPGNNKTNSIFTFVAYGTSIRLWKN